MDLELAIDGRQLVSFTYEGLPRLVQPATLGYVSTDELTLRGCLVAGESLRNTIPCWELYTVAKMKYLMLSGDEFDTFACDGYTRGDLGFVQIIAEH